MNTCSECLLNTAHLVNSALEILVVNKRCIVMQLNILHHELHFASFIVGSILIYRFHTHAEWIFMRSLMLCNSLRLCMHACAPLASFLTSKVWRSQLRQESGALNNSWDQLCIFKRRTLYKPCKTTSTFFIAPVRSTVAALSENCSSVEVWSDVMWCDVSSTNRVPQFALLVPVAAAGF